MTPATENKSTIGKQALQLGSCFDYGTLPTAGDGINSLPNAGGVFRIVSDGDGPKEWAIAEANLLKKASFK
jgi:hypothetical protein